MLRVEFKSLTFKSSSDFVSLFPVSSRTREVRRVLRMVLLVGATNLPPALMSNLMLLGVNSQQFLAKFTQMTAAFNKLPIPLTISLYIFKDKSFDIVLDGIALRWFLSFDIVKQTLPMSIKSDKAFGTLVKSYFYFYFYDYVFKGLFSIKC